MSQQPTFGDLIKFILDNRKDKVFRGETEEQIVSRCIEGIREGTLLYNIGTNNAIDGMILAEDRPSEGVLFVVENLAITLTNLKKFASIAKERWPTRRLEWLKRGIHKQHNTNKIYQKLTV